MVSRDGYVPLGIKLNQYVSESLQRFASYEKKINIIIVTSLMHI